ncbi:MAG TPA: alpha/beta hydrolase [Acidobacteriaceae bacterium]|nr:alpha/beta hydrolase [Acidobacteriaceae bacterium]
MLWLLILPGLLMAGGVYQAIASWMDERRFPPAGRLVDVGGFKLHLRREGSGQPVVVLEAGIAATSISWSPAQARLAELSTVCSYDRAGLGWSEPRRDGSCTLEQLVGELEELLRRSGLAAPFVLVGHSFGGLVVRAFAHAWPEQVAGLVLVDPVSLVHWSRGSRANTEQIRAAAGLSRRGAVLARVGVVRAALSVLNAGGRWFPSHVGRAVARRGSDVMQNLAREIAKLPRELYSTVRAHWSRPGGFLAMAEYLEALPGCAAAGLTMNVPGNIPVTILSAGNATAEELREREAWASESERGRHIKVPGTGHWLQLERPELVSQAVGEMVNAWRGGSGTEDGS